MGTRDSIRTIAVVLASLPFLVAGSCEKSGPADITAAKDVAITLRNETLLPVHLLVRQEPPSQDNRLTVLVSTRTVTLRLREHDNVLIRAHETNELDRRTCVLGAAGHQAGAAVVSWVQGDAGAELDCTTGWENSF